MYVKQDRQAGLVTLTSAASEEEAVLQEIGTTFVSGNILAYKGRGSVDPDAPLNQRMYLRFSYGDGKELILLGTTQEDEKAVRQMRDAIYCGGDGLIFIEHSVRDGKPSVDFTIAHCTVCSRSVISRIECEWHYCDACAAKCEHQYERGAIHGSVDIRMGEFCFICGRVRPKPEDEPEKPLYDHHIKVEEELGIEVVYKNLPGITPRMLKGLREGTMKKILVVEDNKDWSDIIREDLGDKVLVAQAFTIEEAEAVFERNPDLAVILMDACVPGDRPNTMGLVRKMRETFSGPIIAISSVPDYRKELIRAGCDDEAEKSEAAQKVLELISVP